MHQRNKGFTLLEVSIVIVVIGFIVGVVLFGQDIITQAKLRAVITQLERYNAAANVFKDRYGYLPGDIPNITKTSSFFSTPGVITTTVGGGDDFIAGFNEAILFFNHLGALGLSDFYGDGNISLTQHNVGTAIPYIRGYGHGFFPYTAFKIDVLDPKNLFNASIYNAYHLGAVPGGLYGSVFTAREAYNIDIKLDDGMPNTGTVIAFNGTGTPSTFTYYSGESAPSLSANNAATATCTEGAPPAATPTRSDVYKISGNTIQCQLRIKAGF